MASFTKYNVDFKKATTSEEMEKFCMENVINHILKPEGVEAVELYKAVTLKRKEILDSIYVGEVRYLPNANAKELSAYKNPESEQSVRGSLAWNILTTNNVIEFPAKVKMLKLKIFKESDIDDLADTYPEIYEIIMDKIFNDTTGIFVSYIEEKGKQVKKSRGLQVLAIPTNDVIPEWCKPYIDYTSMVNNIVAPFKSVMELLKFQHVEEGKSHNGVSRKSDRLTNIIRI